VNNKLKVASKFISKSPESSNGLFALTNKVPTVVGDSEATKNLQDAYVNSFVVSVAWLEELLKRKTDGDNSFVNSDVLNHHHALVTKTNQLNTDT